MADDPGRLRDLPLRSYRPRPMLRTPAHQVPRPRFPAIDAHNHLGRWLGREGGWVVEDVDAVLETLARCGVEAVVNLDGRWGEELDANLDRYDRAHPGRFATFCHLDWGALAEPDPSGRLVASLERSAAAGAKGLKVWKDLGLRVRDADGALVLPDDPRLWDAWDAAGELGLPIWIHTADPIAFFEPLDERNERLEELLVNLDWSFADAERFPRFDRLLDALEAIVADHAGTTFVGVHAGNAAEDLERVSRMLDAYPNYRIDVAARIAELGRQPRASRGLFDRFPDRILFGTDAFPPDPGAYAVSFRFLETDDEYFPYDADEDETPSQGRWAISGLGLPDPTLERVYASNVRELIPGLGSDGAADATSSAS
jgi:predicted TIM-barrel fold metal-dependent hydrolase